MLKTLHEIDSKVLTDMKYRVWQANLALAKANLVVLTWGNASERKPRADPFSLAVSGSRRLIYSQTQRGRAP